MKNLFPILLLMLAPLVLPGQAAILASEDARFAAQVAQDVEALEDLVADEVVYIHSNALTENKAHFLESVGSGTIRYLEMEALGERQVTKYGRMAISNGLVHVLGMLQDRRFDIQLRYTAVYRKQSGHWQLLRWQSTRVPDQD